MSRLFSPFRLRALTLKNRFVMSPMCMYSAVDGMPNEFHLAHYGARALGGCGAILQEATAVCPEGRISPADLGIWSDAHIPALGRVVDFVERQGSVMGVQLAHAGRKGGFSAFSPGNPERQLTGGPDAWTTFSASALPFRPDEVPPKAMTISEIHAAVERFADAARRALAAGYRFIEIHAAHGYLVNQFLSPLSNRRDDEYGGSFANRVRFLLEIVDAVRKVIPDAMPLWTRLSAVEWVDGGWSLEDSVELGKMLRERGVDVLDASSGGNAPDAVIPAAPGYQVAFAERLRRETGAATAAVGLITGSAEAEAILAGEKADLIVFGRQLLRDPFFPLRAAHELGDAVEWPVPYLRGRWKRE